MELLEKLAQAARRQHEEAGLPTWLVEGVLALSRAPAVEDLDTVLLELLLGQIEEFDSYAGAGCFGESVSAATIENTMTRLRGNG